jgi:hypothetical protein
VTVLGVYTANTTGSVVAPLGAANAIVEVWSAGQDGYAGNGSIGGFGGPAGAYAVNNSVSITAGATYYYNLTQDHTFGYSYSWWGGTANSPVFGANSGFPNGYQPGGGTAFGSYTNAIIVSNVASTSNTTTGATGAAGPTGAAGGAGGTSTANAVAGGSPGAGGGGGYGPAGAHNLGGLGGAPLVQITWIGTPTVTGPMSPTTQLLAMRQQTTDPLQEQTTLLLHFDNNLTNYGKYGQLPSTNFTAWGVAAVNNTLAYDSFGTLAYSNSITKFGGYSFSFNGATQLALNNFFLAPTHQDFTLEYWVYPTQVANAAITVGQRASSSGTSGFYAQINAGGNGWTFWRNNTTLWNNTTSSLIPINTWTHMCVSRKGNNYFGFINGVLTNTATNSDVAIPQLQTFLGSILNGHTGAVSPYTGYMDEFRCQTASNRDPRSAPKRDPLDAGVCNRPAA